MLHILPEPSPRATAADYAACARIIARGSKSFHAASLLLPAKLRGPAICALCLLQAF
jgi:15-cis-phytoene synthase